MAKTENQSGLVLGTNLFLHIQALQAADITVSAVTGTSGTIATAGAIDFTAATSVAGIEGSGFLIGDLIEINGGANEGICEIATVNANTITFINHTGTPSNEAAGPLLSIQRLNKFIEVREASGLSFVDGYAGSALHSKLVTLWNDNDLDRYDPPTGSIEPRAKAMRLLNYWDFFNLDTVNANRDTAWQVQTTLASPVRKRYHLIIAPELEGATDTWKFWFSGDPELDPPATCINGNFMNQLVLIEDTDNGINKRGQWFFRSDGPGKTIAMQGIDLQFAEGKNVTVKNSIDIKLSEDGSGTPTVSDATIAAGGAYTNIDYAEDADSSTSQLIDGNSFDFRFLLDMDGKVSQTVHIKADYLMRQPVNINTDGTGPVRRGDKQFPITNFVGETFTIEGYGENPNDANKNDLRYVDIGGVVRNFATVAAYTLLVPAAFIANALKPLITVYVKATKGQSLADSAVVTDADSVFLRDVQLNADSTGFSFPYSSFNGGGHTANTPLDITVTYNQPGVAEPGEFGPFTINPNTTQQFQLSPQLDPSFVPAA